jgi:hypothetical protein
MARLKDARRPSIPPPQFRLYRFKRSEPTSFVVPSGTTDLQLKSLLWLFREKVRSNRFRDVGITQPTSEHWGKRDYTQGLLDVYRGEKCAYEVSSESVGPCGYGDHDDAYYQWGILGDNPNNGLDPNKDEGGIRLASGDLVKVFDWKDGWQPSK